MGSKEDRVNRFSSEKRLTKKNKVYNVVIKNITHNK